MDKLEAILKNSPDLSLDEDTLAVANSGYGSITRRISMRGGEFRKFVAGQEISIGNPTTMDVIIVKMAHNASRSYYDQAFEAGKKVSPVCWSNDSTSPDPEVLTPQAKFCHACPNSVKGSGSEGRGSACKLSWRLAVVSADDPGGDVMQLVLPANSCFGKEEEGKWPFKAYIQMLVKNNVSAGKLVTKMQFDPNSGYDRILFSPVSGVEEQHKDTLVKQACSQAALSAIKLTVYQSNNTEQQPVKFEVFDDTNKDITTEDDSVADIVNKWKKEGNK
jgi:hypothetical protein